MEGNDFAEQDLLASSPDGEVRSRPAPGIFVFNPFAEGYIAEGKAFTPVKHQAQLAEDLANLPQFLCQPQDIVLLAKRPSADFLNSLKRAGFQLPDFVELRQGRIHPADNFLRQTLGSLRPWAWGPDSVRLLEPLFARVEGSSRTAHQYFNDKIAELYSKTWSADFLRKVLARCRAEPWLCSEQQAGIGVDTLDDALAAIAGIRARGHHRVVVKEAHGLAGHNALRLWEPEILPAQRQWLAHALENGRKLLVEAWLERELDFSVQLEMAPSGLQLCGYTGLINDRKGQFLANWAEADYTHALPKKIAAIVPGAVDVSERVERLYEDIFGLLEAELRSVGFLGPVSIDAFIYRTAQGDCRLKPVVEINPRYTMGRLTLELMRHASTGNCGLFRLVTRAQARAEGFADLAGYAAALSKRAPLQLEGDPAPRINRGALCLNDPGSAQVSLATFEVSPILELPDLLSRHSAHRGP